MSTYGASTIEEAFAEVFEHYCTEEEINRDQLESFRSVLSSTPPLCEDALRTLSDKDRAMVAKVARRFHAYPVSSHGPCATGCAHVSAYNSSQVGASHAAPMPSNERNPLNG